MSNYQKIENIKEFNRMVDNSLDTHENLKTKVKQQRRGIIATERVGQKALTKAEVEAQPIVSAFGNYLELFQNFANLRKGSTEIKLTTKSGKGKIGKDGEIDVADLQDNKIRVYNTKTGENLTRDYNEEVAELLVKPVREINVNDIGNESWRQYLEIMNFVGIPRGANNNRKLQIARQVMNNINQANIPPPQQNVNVPPPPQNPPFNPINPEDDDEGEGNIQGDEPDNSEGRAPRERRINPPFNPVNEAQEERGNIRRRRREDNVPNVPMTQEQYDILADHPQYDNLTHEQLNQINEVRFRNRQEATQFFNAVSKVLKEIQEEAYRQIQPQRQQEQRSYPVNENQQREFQNYVFDEQGSRRRRQRYNPQPRQRGRGFFSTYSNVNEIIERLDLLTRSQSAGNYSTETSNEIMDIIDKLLLDKTISKVEHKKLFKKYVNI